MRLFTMKHQKNQPYRISLKGLAFISAVESGLLPLTTVDGVEGYDDELFDKFWNRLIDKLKKISYSEKF